MQLNKMISVSFILLITGCASSLNNLSMRTVQSIGNEQMLSSDITVTDINRGATRVTWQAHTPKGIYSCEADDMVRRVNCVK